MREIDPTTLSDRGVYELLTMLVVPRPIAWVSTVADDGTRNIAPHSYFNIVSTAPPVVHVTSSGDKDTIRNVLATGEFVVNVVSRDVLQAMNLTSADFPADEDEFAWADLDTASSKLVRPSRVVRARAALECRLRKVLEIGNGRMFFGDVVWVHTAEDLWDGDQIRPERLDPVGRLGGSGYQLTDRVVHLARPTWKPSSMAERPNGGWQDGSW